MNTIQCSSIPQGKTDIGSCLEFHLKKVLKCLKLKSVLIWCTGLDIYLPGQTVCSSERGCGHGQGPCTSNSHCLTAGHYYECSTDCVDRTHFPLSHYHHLAEIRGYEAVWSTLIGRGPTLLRSHWSRASQQSYAIKNQLGHPKPPTRGFGTQNSPIGGYFACSSLVLSFFFGMPELVLYGIRLLAPA